MLRRTPMGLFRSVVRIWFSAMILAATMHSDIPNPAGDDVARLRRGETEALANLLPLYQHRLFRFLVRIVQDSGTAEDLFQLTWVRVIEKISGFHAGRSFDSWLFSIAHNLAIDHLRRKRGVSLDDPGETGEPPSARLAAPGSDPLEQVMEHERGAMLALAIGKLPAIHREILTLRFEEEMKLEEIAIVAGIPLSTVKSRLSRALEGLRQHLSGVVNDEA